MLKWQRVGASGIFVVVSAALAALLVAGNFYAQRSRTCRPLFPSFLLMRTPCVGRTVNNVH